MIPLIPTRVHGVLDYLMGVLLILVPLLWIEEAPVAAYVPMALGAAAILYSLVTRYEFSAAKLLPMPAHLVLDGLSGALLAASPWLFGFADAIWVPHVVLGLVEIAAALTTKRYADSLAARGPDGSFDRRAGTPAMRPGTAGERPIQRHA